MTRKTTTSNSSDGLGCLTVLGLIFITLKLTGHIDWHWAWVLLPFWGGLALGFLLLIIAYMLGAFGGKK